MQMWLKHIIHSLPLSCSKTHTHTHTHTHWIKRTNWKQNTQTGTELIQSMKPFQVFAQGVKFNTWCRNCDANLWQPACIRYFHHKNNNMILTEALQFICSSHQLGSTKRFLYTRHNAPITRDQGRITQNQLYIVCDCWYCYICMGTKQGYNT